MFLFFANHKVLVICIILAIIFSAVYLCAALYPGYWYGDAFLCKQADGSYAGKGYYGQYTLQIDGSTVTVHNDDLSHIYEVRQNNDNVQIYVDGQLFFDGTVTNEAGTVVFHYGDSSHSHSVYADIYRDLSGNMNIVDEKCPSPAWIYNFLNGQNLGTRGNPWMLGLAWLLGIIWITDILFPNLWFRIRYWGIVEDGTPGEFYRLAQYLRRILYPIIIVLVLFLGFFKQ